VNGNAGRSRVGPHFPTKDGPSLRMLDDRRIFEEIVLGTEEKQFSLTNAFLENRMRSGNFFGGSSH
jgi:hypothetical protein